MERPGGRFRTSVGEVSVDGDAVRIDKAPGAHLRSQLSRWRHGERWERYRAAVRFGLFSLAPLFLLFRIVQASTGTATAAGVAFLLTYAGLNLATLWGRYARETEIPLSDVTGVVLDPGERELTVRFDAGSRLFPPEGNGTKVYLSDDFQLFETGETERTLTLPTDDDVRDARSAFHLAGVSVDESAGTSEGGRYDGETETEYRVTTRNGAVFCEECSSQVSPSDRACPSCDYTLRVERPVKDDQRETVPEY